MNNEVEFYSIEEFDLVQNYLLKTFNTSSNKLKKFFNKKFLNLPVRKKMQLNLPIDFVMDGEISPEYEGPAIKILFENEDFLVLDKPEKIFVHPLTYLESNNCLSFLRKNNFKCLNVNSNSYDRGLLYRLDFETSGVLVYVKKNELHNELRNNFSVVAKEKIYHCVVNGNCTLSGNFKHFFKAKGPKGHKIFVASAVENERDWDIGELEIKKLQFDNLTNTSLMQISLKTGLRHQIRAQMSFLGFPLLGDSLYGGTNHLRLCLHATKYSLSYKNVIFEFESKNSNFSIQSKQIKEIVKKSD